MNFKEFVNEMFDSKIKLKIIKNTSELFITEFDVDSLSYFFNASHLHSGYWEIEFRLNNTRGSINIENKNINALKVFSGVILSIKTLISLYDINGFQFSADEISRQKVYDKIINKFIKEIDKIGFQYKTTKTSSGSKYYTFERE